MTSKYAEIAEILADLYCEREEKTAAESQKELYGTFGNSGANALQGVAAMGLSYKGRDMFSAPLRYRDSLYTLSPLIPETAGPNSHFVDPILRELNIADPSVRQELRKVFKSVAKRMPGEGTFGRLWETARQSGGAGGAERITKQFTALANKQLRVDTSAAEAANLSALSQRFKELAAYYREVMRRTPAGVHTSPGYGDWAASATSAAARLKKL
jgi:hypothetical protein